MIERHRKKVKLDLKRGGEQSEIRRESGGTKNSYGKTSGGSYSAVTDSNGNKIKEYLIPDLGGGLEEITTQGGTVDTSNPSVIVAHDSIVQEEDRVDFYGMTVEVQNVLDYPTHKILKTVKVDG